MPAIHNQARRTRPADTDAAMICLVVDRLHQTRV